MNGMGLSIEEALDAARKKDVVELIQIAVDVKSSLNNLQLVRKYNIAENADRYPRIYWSAGIHPGSADPEGCAKIESIARENRRDPFFAGIGEIGLDYFHDSHPASVQLECFERQFALAAELALPVVLHLRDSQTYNPEKTTAITEALALMKRYPSVRGILHCFTYGPREAEAFVEAGWFISFSGIVTYKNAAIIQEAAVSVPLEAILVETDAPFLCPNPTRARINQPFYVSDTLDFIAALRSQKKGEDVEEIKRTIYENSQKFIQLSRNEG